MDIERGSKPEEIIPLPPQYWVKFDDVTHEDLNALLGIYEKATGNSPAPIEEPDFNALCKEFESPIGFAQWQIAPGSALEWRRLITPDGMYVRFKIRGGHRNNKFRDARIKISIQEQIDAYFIDKKVAKPLSEIY